MKTTVTFSGIGFLATLLILTACGSSDKDAASCTDADCARTSSTAKEEKAEAKEQPAAEKSAPGTITIVCGVFKGDAEVAAPCENVTVKVFPGDVPKPKAELTLSGERLVIPNISSKETVNLNLTLKGCAKANLLPSLQSGDTRETYFKLPCK